MTTITAERWGMPIGFQQLTGLSGATSLTVPAGAEIAVMKAETQNVRLRDDGSAPTASVGIILGTSDAPFVYRGELSRVQVIEASASAKLNVSYYGTTPSRN